jgi:hypothetical protein
MRNRYQASHKYILPAQKEIERGFALPPTYNVLSIKKTILTTPLNNNKRRIKTC